MVACESRARWGSVATADGRVRGTTLGDGAGTTTARVALPVVSTRPRAAQASATPRRMSSTQRERPRDRAGPPRPRVHAVRPMHLRPVGALPRPLPPVLWRPLPRLSGDMATDDRPHPTQGGGQRRGKRGAMSERVEPLAEKARHVPQSWLSYLLDPSLGHGTRPHRLQPCIAGWEVVHGYVFDHGGACKCEAFRRLRWWHRKPINPPGQHPTAAQPSRQARA